MGTRIENHTVSFGDLRTHHPTGIKPTVVLNRRLSFCQTKRFLDDILAILHGIVAGTVRLLRMRWVSVISTGCSSRHTEVAVCRASVEVGLHRCFVGVVFRAAFSSNVVI